MIIEMHCHTAEHSSCSTVSAVDLVQRCFAKGVQGLALTDHHYLWPDAELDDLRRQLAVPDYFLLFSGQEVTTADFGDVLVYGAPAPIAKGTPLADIRARYPEAALVWSHPYRRGVHPSPERLLDQRLDGIEIFNSNHTITENHRALRDWHHFKFTALGGTDTHAESYTATYPTLFDHPVRTIGELAAEIRQGRCRPYFLEIPRSGTSDTVVMELALGTDQEGKSRQTVVVKTHENPEAWKSAARTAAIMEEIARHGFAGGRFRIPKPLGHDREALASIEEGIKGKTIFDKLVEAKGPEEAGRYLQLAARWLARLHNCRLQVTPPAAWLENEPERLAHYVSALERLNHPHTRKAQEIMGSVLDLERALYAGHPEKLVQGHGDFHPKNVFIGQDDPADRDTCFVAAIDFDSSYVMPPAFDVGTFLAQFHNQFFDRPEVTAKASPEIFLRAYLQEAEAVASDFRSQVELFKARTSLSIIYYLVKVGLGESENLWRALVEADQYLTRLAFRSTDSIRAPDRRP